jgi:hypothetical protein
MLSRFIEQAVSTFSREFEELRLQQWEIADAIAAINELFHRHYGMDAYRINCGDCEWYADLLSQLMGGTCESFWGDELTVEGDDHERYGYHHITRYRGRYYDSQHPDGVDDFRLMSAFQHS